MSRSAASWDRAKGILKGHLDGWQFDNWIEPLLLLGEDEGVLRLQVPNNFFKDWLTNHYLEEIRSAAREAGFDDGEVLLVIPDIPLIATDAPAAAAATPAEESPGASGHPNLNPEYTFANFVVGKSNQFAHAACRLVAEKPGTGYNPLFIYGGPGMGKTHLMQAIGHAIYTADPGKVVLYVHAERFTNDLVNSLRHKKMDDFQRRYRKTDVLLIDDIQFFAGKTQTMEEFFHTFITMYEAKKQIVLTSDRYPKEIDNLDKRLLTRFEVGLVADIQPPEFETRLAIIKLHADSLGARMLPDDLAHFLASQFTSDVREIKGAVTRLIAFSSLTGSPLTVETAKVVLREALNHRYREINPEEMVRHLAKELAVKVVDLRSKRRSRDIALPRQTVMYILRKATDLSLPAIGALLGGRDHTTVLHAIGKIEEKMRTENDFRTRIETLLKQFQRG